mgnify:CR=1 FL=1
MDLIKINLPSFVEIEGIFFDIKTDFRDWLKFDRLIKDEATTYEDIDYLYILEKPEDKEKGLKALLDFFAPPQELPRKISGGNTDPVIDYELDADLIYSAFLEQYNIDLMAQDETGHALPLHWHKFQALLKGLHNTRLNEIMEIRAFNPNNKDDYNKQMQKLKNAWKIPHRESAADRKRREEFNALFEQKSK